MCLRASSKCLPPYLPVPACIWISGQDQGHPLAHGAVLGHTDRRVRGDVELGAVVVLIQDCDGHLWRGHGAQGMDRSQTPAHLASTATLTHRHTLNTPHPSEVPTACHPSPVGMMQLFEPRS